MNKKEIKQIILEEIEAAVNDMADDITDDNVINNNSKKDLIEPLAAILSIPDIDQNDRIAQAMETGDEDELENLAAGELDRAGLDEMARKSETWKATPKFEQLIQYFSGKQGVEGLTQLMIRVSDNLFKTQNIGFKSRAKKYQSMYFVKGRSVKDGIKGTNDVERMRGFAELLLNPNGFTQKDIQNYVGLKNSAQANDFKMKLYRAKLINVVQEDDTEDVSESKKNLEFDFSQVNTPEKLPIDVEEQDLMDNIKMELKSSADDYQNDDDSKTAQQLKDTVNWIDKNRLTGKVTIEKIYDFLTEFHKQLPGDDKMFLHEPTILELVENEFKPYVDTEEEYQKIVSSVKQYLSSKQPQTMSELEKYIKKVIKEAKNPLAKRMKEIETQGRVAALETKLAAMAEMIEETEGRLTRIDEDNEFKEMMDRNAVKEVRKQLKELERAQAKLQKEYDKVSGGRKRETVVDELDAEETRAKADKFDDLADRQDALDQEAGEVEEVSLELNESTLRFQKLAGLITESDIQKKISLNEEYSKEQEERFEALKYVHGNVMKYTHRRMAVANNTGAELGGWKSEIEWGIKSGNFPESAGWNDYYEKLLLSDPDINSKDGQTLKRFFDKHAKDIKKEAERSARIYGAGLRDPRSKNYGGNATTTLLVQAYETLAKAANSYMQAFK